MEHVAYRPLHEQELNRSLFAGFQRRQVVGDCWRKAEHGWVIQSDPFIDDWDEGDYDFLIRCLVHTLQTGGAVFGAFADGILKGFTSVEAPPWGPRGEYRDLSSLHVSADCRGRGMGTALFRLAAGWARAQGGEKLYISSHSAAETQAFYRGLGCVDASWLHQEHVQKEPFDCQIEYTIP